MMGQTYPITLMQTFQHDALRMIRDLHHHYDGETQKGQTRRFSTNVDWWEVHDDLISTGACATSGSPCDPAAETPFPPYYGLQMLAKLGKAGDTMVSSSSSQSLVAVHAVRQANGKLAVLLDNKDPNNSYTVSLGINGYSANATATIYSYGENSTGIISSSGSATSVTVAPYSLTTLILSPGGNATPTPTTTPTAGITPTPTTTPTATPTVGVTPTPTRTSGSSCKVTYTITNQWPGGFGAAISITNTGTTAINGWTLTFSFTNGQTITQLWNGSYTQSGANATITNASYNGSLAPGATMGSSPGFNGSWSGSNTVPTSFQLNGVSCA